MDSNLTQPSEKIEQALHHFKVDIAGIRAGRANPALIENIPIEAYGSRMKLMEVGNISVPQPTLLTVQVWDASILQSVLKGIQEANLGLNPSTDGVLIRLPIPPLTAERREEFIKILHHKMEEAKVAIRQIRREKLLQELIDKNMVEVDSLGKAKEEELTQI